ncbi:MAG TPA: hypothetical protein VKV73_32895 [Chloroflexota bacterium]|nr:hypothetical protein [Chloroflexota bacterium]
MSMPAYLAGRLLAALPVVFVISLLAFGLEAMTPGDPAYLLLQAAGRQNITSRELGGGPRSSAAG